jgi:hypothetical protein
MKAEGAFFQLRKWYVDCVAADGTTFIGYAARISLGPVRLPYRACLRCPPSGSPRTSWAVAGGSPPTLDGETLRWTSSRLGVRARWERQAPSVRRTLLDDDRLGVDWHCHLPAASAEVELSGEPPVTGLGYAEELIVQGDLRALPIHTLLWGRFIADGQALVWIRWDGPRPLTLVVHNGQTHSEGSLDESGVSIPGGRGALDLTERRVLRDSDLGRATFPDQAWLRRLIPPKLRDVQETKWLSRARWRRPGLPDVKGWAVHERVQWP